MLTMHSYYTRHHPGGVAIPGGVTKLNLKVKADTLIKT
jgi:hypothetical protein